MPVDAAIEIETENNLKSKRYYKNSSEVISIIEDLIHYFLQVGSLNKLAAFLSESIDETIRPNRLAPILGSDETRSINPSTLKLIRDAIDKTEKGEKKFEVSIREKLIKENAKLKNHDFPYKVKINQLAEKVRIPFEVVNWFASSLGIDKGFSEEQKIQSFAHSRLRTEPDWSFQDDAYKTCRSFLSSDLENKWGLIVPTGGGKTRIAIRTGLGILKDSQQENTKVVWVTHRNRLYAQAKEELDRAILDRDSDLPENAVGLMRNRFEFFMVQDPKLEAFLTENEKNIALIIVDEGHHAAAPIYDCINMSSPPRLVLTATPNRTDEEPIHIDGIAYEITYADLFERGVILKPIFENENVPFVDWDQEDHILELAEYLLDRSSGEDFIKTLVITSTKKATEKLYEALQNELKKWADHPIDGDAIGFVHGEKNSSAETILLDNNEFLNLNSKLTRGILVSTNSYLGEGFDDPSINTVVITYDTKSIVYLMQAAGRALRYAPNKDKAFIVQVRESNVQYYFNEEWLYQDISDSLKPKVEALNYIDLEDLHTQVKRVLEENNVDEEERKEILQKCNEVELHQRLRLMLCGREYDGDPKDFDTSSKWIGKIFSDNDVKVFNSFCVRLNNLKYGQPKWKDWLGKYRIKENVKDYTTWRDLLFACEEAKKELRLPNRVHKSSERNFDIETGTTWLRYVTFQFVPNINTELEIFIEDCVNKSALLEEYSNKSETFSLAIKIPHPLAGSIGFLFKEDEQIIFEKYCDELTQNLRENDLTKSYEIMESWRLNLKKPLLPNLVLHRIENFLGETKDTKMLDLKKALSN